MNLKLKNTLIILATLFLGIVIGFLINGRLSQMRIDSMRENFTQKGMDYSFMRALDPTPSQMENIRPILDKYNDIRMENLETHWKQQKEILDAFESEIKPYLTDQQIKKLNSLKQNYKNRQYNFKKHKRKNGSNRRGQNRN